VRLPACKNIELQAAYPSQADGGFAGDLHNSLRVALDRWEKRRGHNDHFRYGRGGTGAFRREKAATATRAEISWNSAPEIKRAPDPEKQKARAEARRLVACARMCEKRKTEGPQSREERLARRRELYLAKNGGVRKKRRCQTAEERKASVKAAKQRYLKRQRAGLVAKTIWKPSKLTEKQRKRKNERQRKYAKKYQVERIA
jgi:hypothetical protein